MFICVTLANEEHDKTAKINSHISLTKQNAVCQVHENIKICQKQSTESMVGTKLCITASTAC